MAVSNKLDNRVHLNLTTESGCDPKKGEYSMSVLGFAGSLDISSIGGVDDVSLIKECIENNLDFAMLPAEGWADIMLKEAGEQEDVFWHKYYEIESITYTEL